MLGVEPYSRVAYAAKNAESTHGRKSKALRMAALYMAEIFFCPVE